MVATGDILLLVISELLQINYRFNNGLILQWGTSTAGGTINLTANGAIRVDNAIIFPISFSRFYKILMLCGWSRVFCYYDTSNGRKLTSCDVGLSSLQARTVGGINTTWIAIGI